MSDNEMRIRVKVDNSDAIAKINQLSKAQDSLTKANKGYATQAGSADYGAGAMGRSTSGLKGMMKGWVSASTGLGTFTASMNPLTLGIAALAKGVSAAGNFAKDSVKDYSVFENTLKQVQIIAGGTQEDMDLLGETAIKVGGNTSKGAQEMADAMVDFAKLGFTAQETAEAMTGIVYAAEASGSSVSEAAGIVASALNTWNLDAGEAERVADIMAKTANETAADMTDLGYTFQYAGAQAKLGGASIEDLAAMTGIMSDQGIKGSKAGTTLRTAFVNLLSPTEGAAAAMEGLGVAWKDAEGNARPTMDVINDLQRATEGLSDLEISDLSTTLFGKTGTAGMSMVLKTTVGELDDLTLALENSTGTAAKQAAEMRQTMEGQLDQLGDSWDAIKLKIGKGIVDGAGLDGVKLLNGALDAISDGLDAFSEGWKTATGLLDSTNGFISNYEDASKFGDAILGVEDALRHVQTESGALTFLEGLGASAETAGGKMTWLDGAAALLGQKMGRDIPSGAQGAIEAFQSLNNAVNQVEYLPEERIREYKERNDDILDITGQTMRDIQVAFATFQQTDNNNVSIGDAVANSVNAGLPKLKSAMSDQEAIIKEAQTNKLNAIVTALNQEKSISEETRQTAIARQTAFNEAELNGVKERNAKIVELQQGLSSQTFEEQASSMEQIQALVGENRKSMESATNLHNENTLGVLRAQADAVGSITEGQAEQAKQAAKDTYTQTVADAWQQYQETKSAYDSTSAATLGITEEQKQKLIKNAYDQMIGTIDNATKMKDGTIGEIDAMDTRVDEMDGAMITIQSELPNFVDTMKKLGELAGTIAHLLKQLDVLNRKMNKKNDWLQENVVNGGRFGQAGGIPGWIGRGFQPAPEMQGPRRARGGLGTGLSGGSTGSTRGTTQVHGATAQGNGNLLGQAGVSQGVTIGEQGKEIVMPVGNSTYMRPFARAVAQELGSIPTASTSNSSEPIQVNLIVSERELASVLVTPMKDALDRKVKIESRGKGI